MTSLPCRLLAVSAVAWLAIAATKGRPMKIHFAKESHSLAAPVLLEVQIENLGHLPAAIEKPEKSFGLVVHLLDPMTKRDRTYTLGRQIVTTIDPSAGRFAVVTPPPEVVTIAPGAAYRFTTDLNDRLFLKPGKYECFLTGPQGSSNRVPLELVMTQASVDRLFELVQDPAQDYSRREWAMDSLRSLLPDFHLELAPEGDSAAVRSQKEEANKPAYARFAQWWKEHRKSVPKSDAEKGS